MRIVMALAVIASLGGCLGAENEDATGTSGSTSSHYASDTGCGGPMTTSTSASSTGTGTTASTTGGTETTTGASSSSGGLNCCSPNEGSSGESGAGSTTGAGIPCSCEGECQAACNPGTGTPLCLSFDGAPIEFTQASGAFALTDEPSNTDWIGGATPWLVLDRDGNGKIDDGRELFGSMTRLPNGRIAHDGFEALRALDTDGDGWLTSADARFAELRLWSDRNQDRIAPPDELVTLESRGIEALQLTNAVSPHCDSRGNCELERAVFYYRDGQAWRRGALIDVHMSVRPVAPTRF